MSPLSRQTLEDLEALVSDPTVPAALRQDLSDYLHRLHACRDLLSDLRTAMHHAQNELRQTQRSLPTRLVEALATPPVSLPALTGDLEALRDACRLAEDRTSTAQTALGQIANHLERGLFQQHAMLSVRWVAQQRTETPANEQVSSTVRLVAAAVSRHCTAVLPVEACMVDDRLVRPREQALSLTGNTLHLWAWSAVAAGRFEPVERKGREVLRITAEWGEGYQVPTALPESSGNRPRKALAIGGRR